MKLSDIPKFRSWGHYSLKVGWDDLQDRIKRYMETYKLNFDPDYQRGRVWTSEQRSAYVEFIMRGGTAARDLIFNCPGWSHEDALRLEVILKQDEKKGFNARTLDQQAVIEYLHAKYQQ